MLTVVVIMGLDQPADGDWLGLRAYLENLQRTYGFELRGFAHDDENLSAQIDAIDADIFGIGHSFGGYELYRYCERRPLTTVLFLDPKPKPWYQWWNPFYTFPRAAASKAKDYYGGFGRPMDRADSERLSLPHEKFPSSLRVQFWIEDEIRRLLEIK